jgi:hypothetical protein
MTHEGERLDRKIKRLERDLEKPITPEWRRATQEAINHLKAQKHSWERPH